MVSGLPLLLAGVAFAGSVAEQIPGETPTASGLVVLLQDASGRYPPGTPPTGTLEDGLLLRAFSLADDGVAPDAVAGDGIYAGLVPILDRGGLSAFTLLGPDGAVVWGDDLPIGFEDNPTVRIHLQGEQVAVLVQTNEGRAPGPEAAEGGVLPTLVGWDGVPFEIPQMGLGPVVIDNKKLTGGREDGREAVRSLLPPVLKGPLLLLGVLLLGGVLFLVGRRPPPLQPVGRAPGGGPRGIQATPTSDGLLDLLRTHAAVGPVLLLAAAERRDALAGADLPHVVCMDAAQPDLPEIRRAVGTLAPLGRVCVVVDGAEALPDPRPGEPADAVVRELLAGLPEAVAVVVLLPPEAPQAAEGQPSGSPESVPVSPSDAVPVSVPS